MIKTLGRLFAKLAASHVELHPTDVCPNCGSQLARELDRWGERPREPGVANQIGSPGVSPHQSKEWQCLNPDCPPQVLQRLQLWVSPEAMDISGCDAALLHQLFERGLVRDAAEFYQLSVAEIAALDGMNETTAHQLVAAIATSKTREAWRVLTGLGIPKLGSAEAQVLCPHFDSLSDLFAAARNEMPKVDGVTELTQQRLRRWIGDPVNRRLVRRLAKAGINLQCESFRLKANS